MSDITLSAGVRQNLLSLQQTTDLIQQTQNRLATGKKVNSALDNPNSFFTSQSLQNRASDLNGLLDAIGQAQQTLAAANQGITSITKLVQSAQSLAKQAQQSAAGTATYSLAVTGNTAIASDTSRATSTSTVASQVGSFTASAKSTYSYDTTSAGVEGNTLKITYGGTTYTFENDATGNGVGAGHISFTDTASLKTALSATFGSAYSASGNVVTLTGSDYTSSFTDGSGTLTGTATAATDGSKLTLTQGSTTATFRYVASGASAGAGTFSNITELNAAIAASSVGNAGPALNNAVYASSASGSLQLESNASFTVGGSIGTALGFSSSAYNGNYNSTLAGITGSLSITVGSGSAQTVDFSSVTTKAALTTALSGITGVTASINGSNQIAIASTTSDNVTIGGTGNSASSLFSNSNIGVNTPTPSAGTSTTRSNLQTQYNDLLTQIDTLANDSSYNGINLLNGDNLKVTFNETGTSSQTISGVTFTSTGLGLSSLSGTEFQTNSGIDAVVGTLNSALDTLRNQSSKFGSNLTTVQTRQDFTKNLITTLQTGADQLVLADTNLEGANLLALQTRQSLSSTALSLSAQADRSVLRLFGG